MTFQIPQAAVPIAERQVCALLNLQTGNGASIAGQDEGGSLRVGGTDYWLFGDTVLNNGDPMIANNLATASMADDPADCLQLDDLRSSAGVATPLLGRSSDPDEAMVWPNGAVSVAPGVVHFFYESVSLAQQPFHVRYVGLAKFGTATLSAARVGDPTVSTPFWPVSYGVSVAKPILVGDTVYVFLLTDDAQKTVLLARVPRSAIEDVSAYTYWDAGAQAYTPDFAQATTVLSEPFAQLPSEVSWNAFLGKWTMVYAGAYSSREVIRVADELSGPWSAPSTLFDCATYYPGPGRLGTYCYSGHQHDEWQSANGQLIYATVSNEIDYRAFLHQIQLAVPVRQYSDAGGKPAYVAGGDTVPAGLGTAAGIAFYAGMSTGPGLSPIHRWISGAEVVLAPLAPSQAFTDGGVAFYAPLSATVAYAPVSPGVRASTRIAYEPVFRWDKTDGGGVSHAYSQFPSVPGFTRGPVAFYAPCPDSDMDGASDCIEAAQGSDPLLRDTDGDGYADAPPASAGRRSASDTAHDNCPAVYNPGQENHDGDFVDLSVYGKLYNDSTWPNSDALGDACDSDADNDGLPNSVETALPGAACPSATASTNPLARDTDGDLVLDGAECALGTDPTNAASKPPLFPAGDSDHDGLTDAFEISIGSNPTNPDTDGDGVLDGSEYENYNTDLRNANTDGDRCTDGKEIASINEDAIVNSVDLSQVARAYGVQSSLRYIADMDLNKDGKINSTDMVIGTRQYGYCR